MSRLPALALLLSACIVQEPAIFSPPPSPGTGPREICGNGLDDDGDGFADEACPATGDEQPCYTGPVHTRGVGICKDGVQRRAQGGVWGPCEGDVPPEPEQCGDGLDGDCDGAGGPGQDEDAGCCVPTGPESCNGLDDDCDGIADDGVLNACGKCPGEICYRTPLETPALCTVEGRACEAIAPSGEDGMTVDAAAQPPPADVIAGIEGGELVAIDPATLEIRWRRELPGASRVASVRDGAWVLAGEVLHRLDRQGDELCRSPLAAPGTALAADARGRAHVAAGGELRAFDPDQVDGDPPACVAIDLAPEDPGTESILLPGPAASLAPGMDGVLWTGSSPAHRVDLERGTAIDVAHESEGPVLVDPHGDAWFAGDHLHRVRGTGPHDDPAAYQHVTQVRGTGLAFLDPYVITLGPGRLEGVLPADLSADGIDYPEAFAAPQGLFAAGGAAFFADGDRLVRYRQDGWTVISPVPGAALRLDQDAWRAGAERLALWSQVVDGRWATVQWIGLEWSAEVDPGAMVEARLAFAPSVEALARARWCGPFRASPADLRSCPGADGSRVARVELALAAASGVEAPVVSGILLSSTRP